MLSVHIIRSRRDEITDGCELPKIGVWNQIPVFCNSICALNCWAMYQAHIFLFYKILTFLCLQFSPDFSKYQTIFLQLLFSASFCTPLLISSQLLCARSLILFLDLLGFYSFISIYFSSF